MIPEKPGSFASLFEQTAAPRSAPRFRVGDRLDAVVTQVGREFVFVEIDGKRQAYLDIIEVSAPDGKPAVRVGDKLSTHVVAIDPESGDVRLGRTMGRSSGVASLEAARSGRLAVEGKVTAVNKGGLEVDFAGVRGFCPMSQVDLRQTTDATPLVGRTLGFLVTEVRDETRGVVVSRRALLEREALIASEQRAREIEKGQTLRGTVTGVREFGAFVDLGGLEGLIPASEVSHERGARVSDAVTAGDIVDVQVKDIGTITDEATGSSRLRITLSLKALAPDPWDHLGDMVREGRVVTGTVTKRIDAGVFVRLAAGVEGLLHVSEIGGKDADAARALKTGQTVMVVVRKIDAAARRLTLVPAPRDASEGSNVGEITLAIGTKVTGRIERIETYGVFVQIDGTAGRSGRGLIPKNDLGLPRGADLRKHVAEGAVVTAKVVETGEGRLKLSVRALQDDEERAQFEGYQGSASVTRGLGTLGELLAKKGKR